MAFFVIYSRFKAMKHVGFITVGVVVLMIALAAVFFKTLPSQSKKATTKVKEEKKQTENSNLTKKISPPEMQINKNKKYTATLKTTEGDIVVSLNASKTPITVNNFVALSRDKFYDETIFHRVVKGFMIQGGDPEGTGMGGPGYKFDDEPFEGGYIRGTVAMANSGPNTNGSQFFIMHKDSPLPKNYVIFGSVVKGMDVVDKIAVAEVVKSASGELSKPVNPVKITSVVISEE